MAPDRLCRMAAFAAFAVVLGMAAGCGVAQRRVHIDDEPVKDVEASDVDLRAMARHVAAGLAEHPVIRDREHIVLAITTVKNRTETIDFDSGAIQSMLREHLVNRLGDRISVVDREADDLVYIARDERRGGGRSGSSRGELPAVDYLLIGEAFSSRKADARGVVSAYHRYFFRLTDAETSVIVTEVSWEFKKEGQRGIAYRGK